MSNNLIDFLINSFHNKVSHNTSSPFLKIINRHRHYNLLNIFTDEIKKRIVFSIITVYATILALIFLEYTKKDVVSFAVYILPLMVVTISTPELGLFQQKIYHILICLLYGIFLGFICSLIENKVGMLIFFFFASAWMCTYKPWAKSSAIGNLGMALIYILKLIYGFSSSFSTKQALYLILIPIAIIFFALFFPVPQLTFFKSKKKMISLSYSISSLINNAIESFLSGSNYELFNAEFDHNISIAVADLKILKTQQVCVKSEIMFFYLIKDYVAGLGLYIETASLILSELQGINQVMKEIVHNKTHDLYSEKLKNYLKDLANEIEILLVLVTEYLDLFHPTPFRFYYFIRQFLKFVIDCIFRKNPKRKFKKYFDSYVSTEKSLEMIHKYKTSFSYEKVESEINYSYFNGIINTTSTDLPQEDIESDEEVEFNYDFDIMKNKIQEEMNLSVNRLLIIRSKILHTYNDVRNNYQFTPNVENYNNIEDKQLYKALYNENKRLGLKNFGPRGAFIHRISMVVESFINFRLVLNAKHDYFYMIKPFLYDLVHPIIFFGENLTSIFNLFKGLFDILNESRKGNFETRDVLLKTYLNQLVNNTLYLLYIIKPALINLIPLCLFTYKKLGLLYNNGMWFFLFTIIIRQETVSSSFVIGYQRLEGTVIGAMYSFFIFQNINLDIGERLNFERQMWVFLPWLCFCSFFRLGPLRGYSATVASFTPFVLLYGYPYGINSCWGRIQETIFAVGLYLVFDTLIFPRRTYTDVTSSVLRCINDCKTIVVATNQAIDILHEYERLSKSTCEMKINSLKSTIDDQQNLSQVVLNGENIDGVGVYGTISDIRDISAGIRANDMIIASPEMNDVESIQLPETVDCDNLTSDVEMEEPGYYINSESNAKKNDTVIESIKDDLHDTLMLANKDCDNTPKVKETNDKLSSILSQGSLTLSKLKGEVVIQETVLRLLHFEPQLLWHRGFPEKDYKNLLLCFNNFYEASLIMSNGIRALSVILSQMILRKEDVSSYINHFQFLMDYLNPISSRASLALDECFNLFNKLYKVRDYSFDLRNLLQLRIDCEKFKMDFDEDFCSFLTHEAPIGFKNYNPYFICAWQNLFEAIELFLLHLLKLGMALQMIKNVESLE